MAETSKKKAPRRTQSKSVRNLRNVHVSLRLTPERKIELAPRGQRGDTAPVQSGDQTNPEFVSGRDTLFEVITAEEAKVISDKQSTNERTNEHPAMAQIRNQLGEKYGEGAVKTAAESEDQGRVVAETKKQAEGVGEVIIDRHIGIRRANLPGTEDHHMPAIPDHVAPEDQAQYRIERAAEAESVEDLGLKVTKGETEKS